MARLYRSLVGLSFILQAISPTAWASKELLEQQLRKLKELEVKEDFDERYRPISLEMERLIDLKRAECLENQNKSERQLCFRDTITAYKDYLNISFDLKTKYLKQLHEKQLRALEEARAESLKEIDRQF